ncbi:DEAD/DEAH box helicase family protein [Paenibacillus oleatilyticus]|uniref:DEAD/DEAH box helicase family protein n=1 Tax=Paenibacillus oleatilyticus TaxID=2594886 RepID=UPI001C1FBC2E|nr:DEAD/DEAH box helicase family protein [Paenibacillus oleatilyticus]MBU7315379.1 DEAD/DEAH box helicase family protein [Paenibacillus oleatilyticus]
MNLSDLKIIDEYRSDTDNIIDDFYVPCLSNSIIYKRSVGYFTSGSLSLVARGVLQLLKNGGRMQLIASPYLSEEDVEAINRGYRNREDIIKDSLLRQLDGIDETIVKERLSFLARLISENRLDIKIAVLRGKLDRGIYHEKLGIFQDGLGNSVVFSGSANETEGGLRSNFEQVDVFCSWRPGDYERVKKKNSNFAELWDNKTNNLDVITFNDAIKNSLLKYATYYKDYDPGFRCISLNSVNETINTCKEPIVPSYITLRNYQKEAIREWFAKDGSGIFEMATGTGKTITALSAAAMWYKHTRQIGVIIVCPYSHLVEQWADETKKFNFEPILAYESRAKWVDELNHQILSYNLGNIRCFCVITTNKTFLTEEFQKILDKISKGAMLIVDEAHHIGAKEALNKLPEHIQFRLALSATPVRWMDPEGTARLNSYFKPGVIYTFGLKEAIGEFLTEYYYYPHIVELTEDEMQDYHDLSKEIARLNIFQRDSIEIDSSTSGKFRNLLIKRAKLIGRARNKTKLLYNLLKDRRDSKFNLFYCGDEKVDGVRQVEEIIRMLGQDLEMKVHPFTSGESTDERKRLLYEFEKGDVQGLVAIRCLDEGVDVPATQTAYILSSSTNPREFIQRRGRILRRHPNKKFAYIHDFIVVPRNLSEVQEISPPIFNTERALIKKELMRASEFANLAFNSGEAREVLLELKQKYNLLYL